MPTFRLYKMNKLLHFLINAITKKKVYFAADKSLDKRSAFNLISIMK